MVRILLCIVSLLVFFTASFAQQPSTVYVFNDGMDRTDQFSKSYIWQELGLLEPNGKPGTIQPNGTITNSQGQVMGSVIKNAGGQIIGYKSANGQKEAYDINQSTMRDAWMRVANNGRFVVMKHGNHNSRMPAPGGGVHVDGGQIFDGFEPDGSQGQGTGVGNKNHKPPRQNSGPYYLPPRPGANIEVILFVCFGSRNPNPSGGKKSVQQTAQNIPGVSSVQAWPVELEGNIEWTLKGNQQQQDKARRALQKASKKAGFHENGGSGNQAKFISKWLLSFPANMRWAVATNAIQGTGAGINLRYITNPVISSGVNFVFPYPMQIDPGIPWIYEIPNPLQDCTARMFVDETDLDSTETFNMNKMSPGPAPTGRWSSGVFDFRELEVYRPTPGLLDYSLDFYGNPNLIRVFSFDFNSQQFEPVPAFTIVGNTVEFQGSGAQICGAVEVCDEVIVEDLQATRGSFIDFGVWNQVEGSAMDFMGTSVITPLVSEPNLFEVTMDLKALGSGMEIDVRGTIGMNQMSGGTMLIQLFNRTTNRFQTVATMPTSINMTPFKFENIDATPYLNNDRQFRLRLKSIATGPLPVTSFITSVPFFEVTSHH